MTSKETLKVLKEFIGIWCDNITKEYRQKINKNIDIIEKNLEVLELIKKTGILDLVFSEDAYCNLIITNRDVINVDYDGHAPDIEMTWEEYEKFRKWLDEKND